jgi:AcrR family transcriptional regulator
MPKLNETLRDNRKLRIEKAAKTLFIKQGFHGTSTRAIAARAGVSLGNVYNYYRTKEEILESIIGRYQKVIDVGLNEMFAQLTEPFQPDNLAKFGHAVGALVSKHSDYWLLMYIDVLEFRNQHFRKMFDGLSKKLKKQFAGHFAELKSTDRLCAGADPSVAFTAVYMQFFDYFLVERLFGGNRHFGISDDQVVIKLSELFCRGVMRPKKIRSPRKLPVKQIAHKRQ